MDIRNTINIRKGGSGYHLMSLFHAKSREARAADNYLMAQAFDTCEDAVNNFHHGLHPKQYFPRLRASLQYLIDLEREDDEKKAYIEALAIFDEYVTVLQEEFGPIEFNWEEK